MDLLLATVGIGLTVIAILFAWRIYEKEKEQLVKMEGLAEEIREIGLETREVAKKLNTDSHLRDAVDRFFGFQATSTRKFTCIFPVFFKRRPLPFIVAGDYHALQVLVGLIGQSRLDLHGIMAGEAASHSLGEDVIYLCTPFANSALEERFPSLRITDSATPQKGDFDRLDLPCWFAEDTRSTNRYKGGVQKKIVVKTVGDAIELESHAEAHYAATESLADDERYTPSDLIQRDLGIILRLTDPDTEGKTVIIAGIHQYGTWIVADFFERLCWGEDISYSDVIGGAADFIAIVWGTFDTPGLRVLETDVEQNYIWIRKDSEWQQVPLSSRWKPNTHAADGSARHR